MPDLIVKSFPIRTNVDIPNGDSQFLTQDGGYTFKNTGGVVTLKPFSYYSSKPDIQFNATIAARATGGRLNNYHPIAVFSGVIAYVANGDSNNYYVIDRETYEQKYYNPFPQPLADIPLYTGFCNYRNKPSAFGADSNFSIEDKDYTCRVQTFSGNFKDVQLHIDAFNNPDFGFGIASFNNPVVGVYPVSEPEIPFDTASFNNSPIPYFTTNTALSVAYGGLARVAASPLVQTYIGNSAVVVQPDYIVRANDSSDKIFTRGVSVRIKLPPIGRDIIDGQILDNSPGNVSVLNYWTNGNNFGVLVRYLNINRSYLWIASLGQDLTAATINYNF